MERFPACVDSQKRALARAASVCALVALTLIANESAQTASAAPRAVAPRIAEAHSDCEVIVWLQRRGVSPTNDARKNSRIANELLNRRGATTEIANAAALALASEPLNGSQLFGQLNEVCEFSERNPRYSLGDVLVLDNLLVRALYGGTDYINRDLLSSFLRSETALKNDGLAGDRRLRLFPTPGSVRSLLLNLTAAINISEATYERQTGKNEIATRMPLILSKITLDAKMLGKIRGLEQMADYLSDLSIIYRNYPTNPAIGISPLDMADRLRVAEISAQGAGLVDIQAAIAKFSRADPAPLLRCLNDGVGARK